MRTQEEIDDDRSFLASIRYFALEKGDPTRYVDFDDARFARLAPAQHAAWKSLLIAKEQARILYEALPDYSHV